jgi:hypothetical protein
MDFIRHHDFMAPRDVATSDVKGDSRPGMPFKDGIGAVREMCDAAWQVARHRQVDCAALSSWCILVDRPMT